MKLFGRNNDKKDKTTIVDDTAIHAPPMEAFHPQSSTPGVTVKSATHNNNNNNNGTDNAVDNRTHVDDDDFDDEFLDIELADYVNQMSTVLKEEDSRRQRRFFVRGAIVLWLFVLVATIFTVLCMTTKSDEDDHGMETVPSLAPTVAPSMAMDESSIQPSILIP